MPWRSPAFAKKTGFFLTDSGVLFAGTADTGPTTLRLADGDAAIQTEAAAKPRWDGKDRILYLGQQIVKRYGRRSPNQEMVLNAFEEEGWPRHMDNPLPPKSGVVTKCRLHDTIRWLNRQQENELLRFLGDGSGEGVFWELTESRTLAVFVPPPKKLRPAA